MPHCILPSYANFQPFPKFILELKLFLAQVAFTCNLQSRKNDLHTQYSAEQCILQQASKRRSEIDFIGRAGVFWIFGKTHRLKTMVKNAASKNAGITPNFAKNHPQKRFFAYISRTTRDIEKSPKQKLQIVKFYIKITCHFFVFDKVKLEESMQKLQTAGGRRGREAGPSAAAALGDARTNTPNRRWLAMLSYERARGLRVSAAREPFFSFQRFQLAQTPENFSLLSPLIYLLMQLNKMTIAFYRF